MVSIGLPVFNGERDLAQAFDALLSQTFADFEIVVSDNASTDGTQAMCEDFARKDARVRYMRQSRNIGAPRNWNAVVHAARGQYFKWASANDFCNACFVEKCLQALMTDAQTVLAFGRTCLVDDETGETADYDGDLEIADERPRDRFTRVCRSWAMNNAQSGLFRLEVLRKTGLDRPYSGGDLELMAELALYGQFKRASDAVLYRRVGRRSMSSRLAPGELQSFIDPLAGSLPQCIAWRRHLTRVAAIVRAPIGVSETLACLGAAARQAHWDRAQLMRELARLFRSDVHAVRGLD